MDYNKFIVAAVVAVLLVVGVTAYNVGQKAGFGAATINYSNSLSQVNLYNVLESLLADVTAVRRPLSGIGSGTTASINFPALSTSTGGNTTTTVVTGLIANLGDLVMVSPNTLTASTTYQAYVSVASTSNATIELHAFQAGDAIAVDPAATTFNVVTFSSSTLTRPASLVTASSTSN